MEKKRTEGVVTEDHSGSIGYLHPDCLCCSSIEDKESDPESRGTISADAVFGSDKEDADGAGTAKRLRRNRRKNRRRIPGNRRL